MNNIIYVDDCHIDVEKKILSSLNLVIVRRLSKEAWNINDAMAIITDPYLILAVINQIDEAGLMEIALLHFMCKPILVTHKAIEEYPLVEKCIDYIDYTSNLKNPSSTFDTWFKWWEEQ